MLYVQCRDTIGRVVKASSFVVLPMRWVVESTVAWLDTRADFIGNLLPIRWQLPLPPSSGRPGHCSPRNRWANETRERCVRAVEGHTLPNVIDTLDLLIKNTTFAWTVATNLARARLP